MLEGLTCWHSIRIVIDKEFHNYFLDLWGDVRDEFCDPWTFFLWEVEFHVTRHPIDTERVVMDRQVVMIKMKMPSECWLTFRTLQVVLRKVFREYYEFCGLGRVHYSQERGGITLGLRSTRSRFPNNPFCDYSSHLWEDTLEVCTISSRYTLWKAVRSRHPYMIQNQPTSLDPPSARCSLCMKIDVKITT